LPRIAVDAMGADGAPRVEVEGVVSAVRAPISPSSWSVTRHACARSSRRCGAASDARIEVRHAPEVITMDDAPSMAVKQKKRASMRVCFDLVKAKRGGRGGLGRQLGRHDGVRVCSCSGACRASSAPPS
jgi:glycerol-3-phosphate acyltransferase PlsX